MTPDIIMFGAMKKLAFLSVLAITVTGCAVFYHKEVVQVPDPAVLTDPEIAEEAVGTKLVYQDMKTGKTEKTTFLSAGDSTIKVLSHGTETAVRPKQMANARLEMSASKMTPQTCIGSTCLGLSLGGFLGWLVGKNIYDDATEGGPSDCAEIFIWPFIVMIAILIAVMMGAAVAGLVLLLSLIFGNVILPNILTNAKVKEIKARAQKLRSLIAQKTGG
ncbi:MAG: hypothetical protein ABIN58_03030 [candidate division WOR-3 bacterium]